MEDKFFDIDEMMVEYAEMSGFDFKSGRYLNCCKSEVELKQPATFKYGNFDVLDMLKSMFSRAEVQKVGG